MPEALAERPTYCRICEAACALIAHVDEEGSVRRLTPDRGHPVSRGFACAKGTRFAATANHPSRVLRPLARQADGSYAPIPWNEAYGLVRRRLKPILDEHGPHALGIYFGNPLAFNASGAAAMLALMRSVGTRNVFTAGSQDCNNKFAGGQIVHGSPVIHPLPDIDHADRVVLLGSNPAVSQSSFVHLSGGSTAFDRLKQRGGELIVVDPRRTETVARWADEHLMLRPGTDVYLLLALLGELRDLYAPGRHEQGLAELLSLAEEWPVERAAALTGLETAAIRALAERLRGPERTALHMSVGVNQGPFGTLCYVALQALSYLTGNMDRRGGHLFHPLAVTAARLANQDGVLGAAVKSRIGGFPSVLMSLPGGILADEITAEGPDRVRALIAVAGDPARSIPGGSRLEEAFGELEFLVTVDMFQSATGRMADLVLPATSWLERWGLATTTTLFQQASMIQMAAPVTAPPGDVRNDARILSELATAMGRPLGGSRWLGRAIAAYGDGKLPLPLRLLSGVSAPVRAGGGRLGLPTPVPRPGSYLGRGPRTRGRRLRFWHADLEGERARLGDLAERFGGGAAAARAASGTGGSLTLISRRRRLGHNSWLHGGQRAGDPEAVAWMHPADMADRGWAEAAVVRIAAAAATGAIELPVHANEGVAPGTIVVPHGLPEAAANINAVVPSGAASGAIEPLSGQHWMTGVPVRVEAAARAAAPPPR